MAKEIKIVYDGPAKVTRIDYKMFKDYDGGLGRWIYGKLPEADRETAFMLQVFVTAEGNQSVVEFEVSHRELAGKMLERYKREDGATPTQADMAFAELAKRGLCVIGKDERGVIESIFSEANVGKSVEVQMYHEADGDGGFYNAIRARFAFPRSRLPWLKAVNSAHNDAPAPSAQPMSMPAPEDDDIPF